MKPLSRRAFVRTAALAAAASSLASRLAATPAGPSGSPASGRSTGPAGGPPRLHWLGGRAPAALPGTAWGVSWPQGRHGRDTSFALRTAEGAEVPVQSWPTAYWPDGSLKWTAHALPADAPRAEGYVIDAGRPAAPRQPVRVRQTGDRIEIDTGVMRAVVLRSGPVAVASLVRDGREIARDVRLVGLMQNRADEPAAAVAQPFTGEVEQAVIEQDGPVRAVLKLTGRHRTEGGRHWLPFTLRLYFHAGGDAMRLTHTFVYDGDEQQDFIRGLGLRFAVPMRDELHNRHVRFAGPDAGVWAEAVRGITGLRRDPGEDVRAAQIAGIATPPADQWDPRVGTRLEMIPAWGDFTLSQLSANAFTVRKRTKAGHAWVPADQGGRASGLGYVGGVSGGAAFGLRDFWQAHPSQLDVRDAHTDTAEATVWLWSPEGGPMDLRFYHDGLGLDTHPEQLEAMEVTYEDYEPGFGTPHGIARTSELTLWALDATPPRERFAEMAQAVRTPPLLAARPEDHLAAGVFGRIWDLPDRSTPEKAKIEQRLDWSLRFYDDQVEQRHWYGFWDYGDVMHTYDRDRHVWRYDIGGFAWDNSELSPDLWLWLSYLRSGDERAFRLADAMTRHNRDVDIYHLGRFAGLGTRHNVQHWGCSAKQLRISTAAYRRYHYFLTADDRTGDVLDEVVQADRQLARLNPVRKLPGQPPVPAEARIGVGTDWGSAAANWLTAWERTGDPRYRDWLVDAMRTIGAHDYGFFVGSFGFDPDTKRLIPQENPSPTVSHLSAVFGLVEVCAELIQLLDVPEFERAWVQYCTLYNASPEQQAEVLGRPLRGINLRVGHSRLTAYAAHRRADPELAARAWREFNLHEWGPEPTLETTRLDGPTVLNPVDEAAWVSTNDSAQWGLAAIQNLALVPAALGR